MSESVKKNVFSFLLGLALFAGLLYWIRASTVMEHLSRVGPWIAVVILGYGLVQLCFVLAWRVLLDSDANFGLARAARFRRQVGRIVAALPRLPCRRCR